MQYVTFIAGGETFAVEMAPVQEIIRVPDVVRVPLAPTSLNGLANLRGKVLPIVDLRQVCGFDSTTTDDTSRALVLDYGEPLGFVVDKVVSVIAVESAQIEDVGTITSTVHADLLSGLITNAGDQGMVMVLDFRKVIEREFAALAASSKTLRDSGAAFDQARAGDDAGETADELQLVSFHVAGQEYAVAIDHVQEIVPVPEAVVRVPHAASHVVGVMTLRERVLPLVSLRGMFGLPPQRDDSRERVVVMTMNGGHVGVVTDSVSEVLRVPRAALEPMPRLLAQDGGVVDVTQLCQIGNGQRLVSVVDVQALFRHDRMQEAIATVHNTQDATATAGESTATASEELFVVLRLGRDEFGVPISAVQEIVRLPDTLTRVPRAPEFVEGVINLRGAVLPVIDLRRRLGLPAIARTDGQRVMVFTFDGTRTGFIVDAVAEVLSIPTRAISDAPRLSAEQGTTLSRMANLEQQRRIVQLIAPQHLLGALEREALDVGLTELAA